MKHIICVLCQAWGACKHSTGHLFSWIPFKFYISKAFGIKSLPFGSCYSTSLDMDIHVLINTLRPRQNDCYFADNIFKFIFLNENVWILIKISLKFVPKGSINNIPTLVQIMAWDPGWHQAIIWTNGAMMVSLPTHICVTRPQWVTCISESLISIFKLEPKGLVQDISKSTKESALDIFFFSKICQVVWQL